MIRSNRFHSVGRFASLIAVLFLVTIFVPTHAEGQCTVTTTSATTFTSTISVVKFLDATFSCRFDASNNANFCFPSAGFTSVGSLIATATTGAASPSCEWVCNCGPGFSSVPFRTDGGDGLPVELMEFSIEAAAMQESAEPNEDQEFSLLQAAGQTDNSDRGE